MHRFGTRTQSSTAILCTTIHLCIVALLPLPVPLGPTVPFSELTIAPCLPFYFSTSFLLLSSCLVALISFHHWQPGKRTPQPCLTNVASLATALPRKTPAELSRPLTQSTSDLPCLAVTRPRQFTVTQRVRVIATSLQTRRASLSFGKFAHLTRIRLSLHQ